MVEDERYEEDNGNDDIVFSVICTFSGRNVQARHKNVWNSYVFFPHTYDLHWQLTIT